MSFGCEAEIWFWLVVVVVFVFVFYNLKMESERVYLEVDLFSEPKDLGLTQNQSKLLK